LYAGVVQSKLLYRAPIWAVDLKANRRSLLLVKRFYRAVAIRTVRGFSTILATAAAVVAGFPPFELQALGVQTRPNMLDSWRASLDKRGAVPGLRVVQADQAESEL
jgi:hypothetical protein